MGYFVPSERLEFSGGNDFTGFCSQPGIIEGWSVWRRPIDQGGAVDADPYIFWCAVPIAIFPDVYGTVVCIISLIIRIIREPRLK